MECIVLAGGLGSRLRSVVSAVPKPLAPINGAPFLDLLLQKLKSLPLTNIVLAVGYKAEQIVERYRDTCSFSVEDEPLGTGGALKRALEKTSSELLLVVNGDSFLDFSFDSLYEAHVEKKADLTLAARWVEDARPYGLLTLDDLRITAFTEKKPQATSGYINCGTYLIRRECIEELPFTGPFSLEREGFALLLQKKMFAHLVDALFIDIGTPESLELAQTLLSPEFDKVYF